MAKIKLLVMKNCYINHSYFCSSCLVLLDSFTLYLLSVFTLCIYSRHMHLFSSILLQAIMGESDYL